MTLNRINIQSEDYYNKIIEFAEENPDEEVCGFVYLDRLLNPHISKEVNQSDDKRNSFSISPRRFIEQKNIIGIYHSHPYGGPEPSEMDKANSEEMQIPFLIYSIQKKDFWLHYPDSYEPVKLTGRPFVRGFYQCFCLIKDYLRTEAGINEDYSEYNYWPDMVGVNANKYLIKLLHNKFTRIRDKSIKKHDILIFDAKDVTYHVGMYAGFNRFYHHASFKLSDLDDFNEKWQRRVKYVFRHNSFV